MAPGVPPLRVVCARFHNRKVVASLKPACCGAGGGHSSRFHNRKVVASLKPRTCRPYRWRASGFHNRKVVASLKRVRIDLPLPFHQRFHNRKFVASLKLLEVELVWVQDLEIPQPEGCGLIEAVTWPELVEKFVRGFHNRKVVASLKPPAPRRRRPSRPPDSTTGRLWPH